MCANVNVARGAVCTDCDSSLQNQKEVKVALQRGTRPRKRHVSTSEWLNFYDCEFVAVLLEFHSPTCGLQEREGRVQ